MTRMLRPLPLSEQEWLTVEEASAVARVSPKTIRRAIPTELTASRPGRRRFLIRRRDLNRWLEDKRLRPHDATVTMRSILNRGQP